MATDYVEIGSLVKGQHIIINEGFGQPSVVSDTADIVYDVQGNSALTVGGICLTKCSGDGYGITVTGAVDPNPIPGPEACAIISEIYGTH